LKKRAVVIIDYQNIHLTGHGAFGGGRAKHEALVHPLHFANRLLATRNEKMGAGYDHAELAQVFVFRGLPSSSHNPKGYARNLAQKSHWEEDSRVIVEHRPLTYRYHYNSQGQRATDANGKPLLDPKRPVEEKGVDVMCALAFVREARSQNVDIAILASHDTDLIPALDEVLREGTAKVETMNWYDSTHRYRAAQLRSIVQATWNTSLRQNDFDACLDLNVYP